MTERGKPRLRQKPSPPAAYFATYGAKPGHEGERKPRPAITVDQRCRRIDRFLGNGPVINPDIGAAGQTADNGAMTHIAFRTDRLHATLTGAFSPVVLHVQDDSAHHAGHSGAQEGGQSHYSVLLVSAAFQGMSRVARSRAVHAALAAEFGPAEQGGMHALALTLRTPAEHAAQAGG